MYHFVHWSTKIWRQIVVKVDGKRFHCLSNVREVFKSIESHWRHKTFSLNQSNFPFHMHLLHVFQGRKFYFKLLLYFTSTDRKNATKLKIIAISTTQSETKFSTFSYSFSFYNFRSITSFLLVTYQYLTRIAAEGCVVLFFF